MPKLLYNGLPWFYLAAGLFAFFGTVYVSTWLWLVPHYLLFSLACMHLAFVVLRKRHRAQKEAGGLR
ncbi:MAG TPA: hypothetical protein VE175_13285 [Woeseiaceae bacterium]|nr:hypothetical protein [Woeseiaceae bacterium]